MPRYRVSISFRKSLTTDIYVFARDEQAAEEKACDIVEGWEDVIEAEADDCEEIEG